MMNLKRRKPEKLGIRSEPQVRCPAHMQWVRGFPCCIEGKHECSGKIEAHHVRLGTDGGTSCKPSDTWCVPVCSIAHAEIHNGGQATFDAKYGVDCKAVAERMARVSPHRFKWLQP